MKKNLLKIISFVLIFALLVVGYSELIRDKESSFEDFYDLPKDSVDVFIVGSSHAYSGYIPAVLWEEYGISAYNVYAWAMPMWTAYHYVKEGLKTQSPSVVCLDVSTLWYGAGYETEQIDEIDFNNNQNLRFGLNRYELLLASLFNGSTPRTLGEVNDVTRYHNRWRSWFSSTDNSSSDSDISFLRNFGALYTTVDYELLNLNFYKDMLAPRDDVLKYLNKLYDLSLKEDFHLVFLLTPCDMTKNAVFVANYVKEYCRLNNIDFLDFMDQSQYNFDLQFDMADVDHLNYHGAFKATRYLGEFLKENFSFPDPESNIDSAQISQDARAVYKMINMNEVLLSNAELQSVYDWVRTAENQRTLIISSNPQSLTANDTAFLESLGINPEEQSASVVSDGSVKESWALDDVSEVSFPDMDLSIAEDTNGYISLSKNGYILNSSNAPLTIFIYDYDMERSCYIVNIDKDTYDVYELVQLLRGAG